MLPNRLCVLHDLENVFLPKQSSAVSLFQICLLIDDMVYEGH